MRLLAFGFFGLALALAPCHGAVAQEWPVRPVTVIVPFPAGGPADIAARAVASALSETLGKQFIIDNRAGAGGNIGGGCGRQGACRWLYAAVHDASAGGAQQVHVQEPAL
jgi:tripartite-type tricarboxylate transporter receptor subunit TctC